MKKFRLDVLLLCFLFVISGCGKQQEKNPPKVSSTPLLFEVKKEEQTNTLYLFGSIHAGEETLYPLSDSITSAYQNSDILAVEFDLVAYEQNLDEQIELLTNFVNPDGKKIQEYIGDDLYQRGVEILKGAHLYSPMFDYYNPMMWQMLLENAVIVDVSLDEQYGIDKHFLKQSREDEKEILELESAESQYEMLLGFEKDVQIHLLEQALDGYEDSKEQLKTLYELYKKGNQEELEALLFEEDATNIDEFMEQYNEELITKRNQKMFDSLKKAMNEGKNIFCTVGLAHIIGEDGIVDLFEQQGYSVSVVR